IVASLDGIVMGGGVGLSYGASHRIVTDKTKWSMPEMNIGFFPDVGAAYFLNKAPGYIGRYLALNAEVLTASEVLYINGADYYMPKEQLSNLLKEIKATNWHETTPKENLTQLVESFAEKRKTPAENLEELQEKIDQHFKYDTVEEIIKSLESDSSDFAQKTKENMLSKSPVSLKVTLKQLKKGKRKTIGEMLVNDYTIGNNAIYNVY